jgi:rod shape-determining protein MreD
VKRALVVLGLALLALVVQSAAARVVAPRWCPDLGLLVVVGLGLALRSPVAGVVLSAAVGYLCDLLSGSLLGQHMLLRMAAFGVARVGSRKLNLRGAVPLAVFGSVLAAANVFALWALVAFFASGPAPPPPPSGDFLAQALVNGILAPPVAAVVSRVCQALGRDEEGTRLMRLEPRKFAS